MRANGRTTTLFAATAAQIAFQAPRVMEAFKQQGWMHEIFGCSGIRPVESGCHQQTAAPISYHVSTAQIQSHPTSRNGLCPKFMTSKMGGGEKRCRSCSSLKNAACQFVAWTWHKGSCAGCLWTLSSAGLVVRKGKVVRACLKECCKEGALSH